MGQVSIGGRLGRWERKEACLHLCCSRPVLGVVSESQMGLVTLAGEGVVLVVAQQVAAQPTGLGSRCPFLATDVGVE